jgi:hypothetical protein
MAHGMRQRSFLPSPNMCGNVSGNDGAACTSEQLPSVMTRDQQQVLSGEWAPGQQLPASRNAEFRYSFAENTLFKSQRSLYPS